MDVTGDVPDERASLNSWRDMIDPRQEHKHVEAHGDLKPVKERS